MWSVQSFDFICLAGVTTVIRMFLCGSGGQFVSPEVPRRETEQPGYRTPISLGMSWRLQSRQVTSVMCDWPVNCCMKLAGEELCCVLALPPIMGWKHS